MSNPPDELANVTKDTKTDLDAGNSSSLSELSHSPTSPPQPSSKTPNAEVDSDAETERLQISPQKPLEATITTALTFESLYNSPKIEGPYSLLNPERGTLGKRRRLPPSTNEQNQAGEPSSKRSSKDRITNGENVTKKLSNGADPKPIQSKTKILSNGNAKHIGANKVKEAQPEAKIESREHPKVEVLRKIKKNSKGRRKGKAAVLVEAEASGSQSTKTNNEGDEAVGTQVMSAAEELLAKRKVAALELSGIEKDFIAFRSRIVAEQLEEVEAELKLLEDPDLVHEDCAAQMRCIDKRRDEKVKYEVNLLKHSLAALARRTAAERQLIHSQYYQEVRDIRSEALSEAYRESYALQRRLDLEGQNLAQPALYNPDRAAQMAKQSAYNLEVSLLSGIAANVGFPSAPDLDSLSTEEAIGDLHHMGVKQENRSSKFNRLVMQN